MYQDSLYVLFSISLVISGLIAYFEYKTYAKNRCELAEKIFQLRGMRSVVVVNFNKITKEREQQLKNKGEWHSPDDENKIICPSAGFISSPENLFYYWLNWQRCFSISL